MQTAKLTDVAMSEPHTARTQEKVQGDASSLYNWGLIFIIVLAIAVRLYGIERNGFTLDEIGQVQVANTTLWQTILKSGSHHGNAPLDYIVTHLIRYAGTSEGILRLPAMLWGVLAVAATCWIGKRWFHPRVGLYAGFLLALTPLHVHFSQIVRFYSLATLMGLLTVIAFLLALENDSWIRWGLFTLVFLAGLYAHYYLLIIGFLLGIWLLFRVLINRRYPLSTVGKYVLFAGVAVVLFLPWVYYDYMLDVRRGLEAAPFNFNLPSWRLILASYFFPADNSAWWTLLIIATLLAWSVAAIFRVRNIQPPDTKDSADKLWLFMLIAFGSVFFVLALDYARSYFFARRQLLIYTPFLLLAFAAALNDLAQRFIHLNTYKRAVGTTAMLLAVGISLVALGGPLRVLFSPEGHSPSDWRGTASLLSRHLQYDDLLFVADETIKFYLPEHETQIKQISDPAAILDAAGNHQRVWLLLPDIGILKRRYTDVYSWIQEQNVPKIYVDSRLPLYIYANDPADYQLKGDLLARAVESGSYSLEDVLQSEPDVETLEVVTQLLNTTTLDPATVVPILNREGRALSDAGNHALALDLLLKAVDLNPNATNAWMNLGFVYGRTKEWANAIDAYRQGLALNPDHYWGNILLGELLQEQEAWSEVIPLGERAVDVAANDSHRFRGLVLVGNASAKIGEIEKACAAFAQALAIERKEPWITQSAELGCVDE